MSSTPVATPKLQRKDFVSDQDVRWCPGCGDYAILAQVQKIMPELGVARENTVFISGIGCSSRFPYYMNTYGFHSIHGRAPAIATGLKAARPELSVWVVTGDGDALSIGGNHLIHILRRNVDVNILLFNNRIYGLTKGQYSPTSEQGKVTKSTPLGSIDYPFNPISVALGSEATFVARSVDVEAKHLQDIVRRAHAHRGTSFVEILQNCNIFNDGAFADLTEKETKAETQLVLEHGKPLLFGKARDKGLHMRGHSLEVVQLGTGLPETDIIVHDEQDAALGYLLSLMRPPKFPTPIGVFRAVERPTYECILGDQIATAKQRQGEGDLEQLLNRGDTWVVE
jgi:2-oxoglutarate/2-oxoacid ferredoxin oxidoreductase subunit beta